MTQKFRMHLYNMKVPYITVLEETSSHVNIYQRRQTRICLVSRRRVENGTAQAKARSQRDFWLYNVNFNKIYKIWMIKGSVQFHSLCEHLLNGPPKH